MRESNNVARKILNELKPVRNKKEFQHFRLMADLREYYLAYKELESEYNSENFTRNKSNQLIPELERLRLELKKLDDRFSDLNKGFLYDSEIRDQNRIRNEQVNVLYKRIVGAR